MCSKQYYSLRNIARLITFKEVMLGESHCSWGVINDNHLAGEKTWDIPEPVLMTLFPEARSKQRMALPGLPETLKKGTHLCNHIHTQAYTNSSASRQPSTSECGELKELTCSHSCFVEGSWLLEDPCLLSI